MFGVEVPVGVEAVAAHVQQCRHDCTLLNGLTAPTVLESAVIFVHYYTWELLYTWFRAAAQGVLYKQL